MKLVVLDENSRRHNRCLNDDIADVENVVVVLAGHIRIQIPQLSNDGELENAGRSDGVGVVSLDNKWCSPAIHCRCSPYRCITAGPL